MPKIIDVDATKLRIVKAAWRVIATKGILAASFRRVAIEAGCTTGLITHYFKDKDSLVTYAYRKVLDKMIADASLAISRNGTVLEKLVAAVEIIEPTRPGERDFTVVLLNFWAAAAFNDDFAAQCRADYKAWREIIGRAIRDGIRNRELRPNTDIRLLTDMLTLLSDGLSVGLTLTPAVYPTIYRQSLIRRVIEPYLLPALRPVGATVKHSAGKPERRALRSR
jgi:TetR/AcrR family transcriptional regulator, transcriptional repressor of bet genes